MVSSRDVIPRMGVCFPFFFVARSPRFSTIVRAYAAILRDELRSGIIATLVISNLFLISRRVPFVNSSRKQKSFLPREIFHEPWMVWNRV